MSHINTPTRLLKIPAIDYSISYITCEVLMQNPAPKTTPDTLRWAVFLALLGTTQVQAQGALTPTPGPGGTPIIDNGHGVPVIDIVAPNASGLSHNQFLDYNVGKQGVVLNNALQAGQSQLAGQLGANPQFQGQAASTILNEVIGQNASRIEGAQEIFGQKADYLLANPNGITVNGGSFINTTRAGFVVGNAHVQDGQVKHLDSRDARGALDVLGRGLSNGEGALELIAPRIDAKGLLLAKDDLNLTVGRNTVDAESRAVLQHLPGVSGSIDASLLGSMRAGQIRIVSTAEGAGVQIGGMNLHAERGDLSIQSAGNLVVQGDELLQTNLTSSNGKLALSAERDLQFTAANGKGRQVELNAGKNLTLDTITRETLQSDPVDWVKKSWFVTTESRKGITETTDRKIVGSRLVAQDNLDLLAGNDLTLTAAQLEAGNTLNLRSGNKMTIGAGLESRDTKEQHSHSIYLDRTDTDGTSHTEQLKASTLKGNKLVAHAGSDMQVSGSHLNARHHLQLDTQGDLTIESAEENDHGHRITGVRDFVASAGKTATDSGQYSAKIGYEHLHKDEKTASTRQVASSVSAGTVSLASARKLTLKGSEVEANAGSLTANANDIELAAAYDNESRHTLDTTRGAALSATIGTERVGVSIDGYHGPTVELQSQSTVQRSALKSSGDMKIDAAKLVTSAAQVQAQGSLEINADTIDNRAAADTTVRETLLSKWDGGLGVSADYAYVTDRAKYAFDHLRQLATGQKAESTLKDSQKPNLEAKLALEHQSLKQRDTTSTAQVSTFDAGRVIVQASDSIRDEGTDYNAKSGDLRIVAGEHQMLAASDRTTRETSRVNAGGSLRVDSKTLTDVNGTLEGHGGSEASLGETTITRVGSLQGKHGVQVALTGNGHYEGTRIDGGEGAVRLDSQGDLILASAHDRTVENTTTLDADLALKAGTALIGVNGGAKGSLKRHTYETRNSKARVAQIDSKRDVGLSSQGDLRLEGTRIGSDTAATGDITLHSDGLLTVTAASDTETKVGGTWGGKLDATGSAVGGGLGAEGTFGRTSQHKRTAIGATFDSNGAVQLTSLASHDAALNVQGLQASARKISLEARHGGVLIEAAGNTEQRDNLDVTLGAGAKLSALGLGGANALVQLDLDTRNNTTWSDSRLRADTVELQSKGDTRIEGAQVEAHHVAGEIGGDLLVASRKNQTDAKTLNVDIKLNQKDAADASSDAKPSLADAFDKGDIGEIVGALWSTVTDKVTPAIKGGLSRKLDDTVTQQTTLSGTQGIDLDVGGTTHLVGAKVQASDGKVDFGSSITRQNLSGRDYQKDTKVNVDLTPGGLTKSAVDFFTGLFHGKGEGNSHNKPYESSGHDTTTEYVSQIEQGRKG
ncbi:hemagglutinin repeat-containing protein [Pseudomonas mosselii]|uniref:hemagglutinin repeat-containing protein n=1 Tax=Pseudomonas mosselii TaxID=78327 RepID=UPI002602FC29|nr:hemagglutinin repeat-containing protein [Pseudomonas mosselii]MDN4496926.1 hemagglutinin repeat-containing protein [Pseudomonas mosselii]